MKLSTICIGAAVVAVALFWIGQTMGRAQTPLDYQVCGTAQIFADKIVELKDGGMTEPEVRLTYALYARDANNPPAFDRANKGLIEDVYAGVSPEDIYDRCMEEPK